MRFILPLFLLLIASTGAANAALLRSYLSDTSSEIDYQLSIATNAVPMNKALVLVLKGAQKQLNRPVAATMANDLRTLTVVSSALMRTSLSNTFEPYLHDAVMAYLWDLDDTYGDLLYRAAKAYPSGLSASCFKLLSKVNTLLDQAFFESRPAVAANYLSQAAARIRSVELIIPRAEAVLPGTDFLKATINGKAFLSRGLRLSTFLSGNFLQMNGLMLSRYGGKELQISFNNLSPGENFYQFNGVLTDATGVYAETGPGVSISGMAMSGWALVTVDVDRRVIYGTFKFSSGSGIGSVTLENGGFSLSY